MNNIRDVLIRFADKVLMAPSHKRVGVAMMHIGLGSMTLLQFAGLNGYVQVNVFGLASGKLTLEDSNVHLALTVGVMLMFLGYLMAFRLSPSTYEAMARLSALLAAHDEPANYRAIQAEFQRAFRYEASISVIRKLIRSENPLANSRDYGIAKQYLRFFDDRFTTVDACDLDIEMTRAEIDVCYVSVLGISVLYLVDNGLLLWHRPVWFEVLMFLGLIIAGLWIAHHIRRWHRYNITKRLISLP